MIIEMSITASFAVIVVLIARLVLKRSAKIFSYVLWLTVLFRLLCPISFESSFALLKLPNSPSSFSVGGEVLVKPQIDYTLWVIWVAGVLSVALYSIVSLIRLKRKLIGCVHLRENIYIADHINVAFVMGLFKAKIYLPSSLSENERDIVLLHEKCHIRRLDYLTRIFALIALSIHWFNPFVWLAFFLSQKDMEMSCDEAVLRKIDQSRHHDYAYALLRQSNAFTLNINTILAFGSNNSKERIKNIMKYKKSTIWISAITIMAVAVLAVALIGNEPVPSNEVEALPTQKTEVIGTTSGNESLELVSNYDTDAEAITLHSAISDDGGTITWYVTYDSNMEMLIYKFE